MRYKITKHPKKKFGFDIKNLNTSVRPQDDFFQYSIGGWLARNPIPSTESAWGSFQELRDTGLFKVRALLDEIKHDINAPDGSPRQIIRDFYRSGMDGKQRNRSGLKPLRPFLDEIDAIETKDELLDFIAKAHTYAFGVLWNTFVSQDEKHSGTHILHLEQDGLSLPDKEFYLREDRQSEKIKKKYREYIAKIFIRLGEKPAQARELATQVFELEMILAHASMDKTDARNIEKVYNKKRMAALKKLAPQINWKRYFAGIGIKEDVRSLVVMQPNFIKRAGELLGTLPIEAWKPYLRFTVADEMAPYLTEDLQTLRFNFYGKILMGNKEMKPRWKYVTSALDEYIGEAVGREYVKKHFPPRAKKEINKLVDDLFAAFEARLKDNTWMTRTTKRKALNKLSKMDRKLGYPEKWKSYRGLKIHPRQYAWNICNARVYEHKRNMKKLGKPVDRKEWICPPQTVNAFYFPEMNEIIFPAGILQPPFFDSDRDSALNYGAIGTVIGHEITHGFDDEGAKFDGGGNFKNWWTKEDEERFKKRGNVLVKQFDKYEAIDGLRVNGKLTLGENIADLGGAAIAFDAYMRHLEQNGDSVHIADFSPARRFFLGLALVECGHARTERERTMIFVDPHSPFRYRVNGPVSNLSAFYGAFGVKKGDKLYRDPKNRARIW